MEASCAPGREIARPPVLGVQDTGPPVDPSTEFGQWFIDSQDSESYCRYEFYDNVEDYGGSSMGALAIRGAISLINYDGNGNITGFEITARITNDMPSLTDWAEGVNSHIERLDGIEQYDDDMFGVKLAIEFADDGVIDNFPVSGPPYEAAWPPFEASNGIESNIYSINHDGLAWFCYSDTGAYLVPTWDFGDIPKAQSAVRVLEFGLYIPAGPGEGLYTALLELEQAADVLSNRTNSLKISNYFDMFCEDAGPAYPEEPIFSSNCSAFFNLEPEQPDPPVIDDVARNPDGEIEITWTSETAWLYRIEASTNPYDYDESNMTWTTVADDIAGLALLTTWNDPSSPAVSGDEKYYRVYLKGPSVDIRAPYTVGAMVTSVGVGRNLVSSPFEVYPVGGISGGGQMGQSVLDKAVGNQVTGGFINFFSDTIESWNPSIGGYGNYERAWFDTTQWLDWGGGPPAFGWNSDTGYWMNIPMFNPARDFVQCGRVTQGDRVIPVSQGRNLLGSCYPVSRALDKTGLVGSGLTGASNRFFSDTVELWNPSIGGYGNYDRAWFNTGTGQWEDWSGGPFARSIQPGDSFWVTVPFFNQGFNWIYPLPPGNM